MDYLFKIKTLLKSQWTVEPEEVKDLGGKKKAIQNLWGSIREEYEVDCQAFGIGYAVEKAKERAAIYKDGCVVVEADSYREEKILGKEWDEQFHAMADHIFKQAEEASDVYQAMDIVRKFDPRYLSEEQEVKPSSDDFLKTPESQDEFYSRLGAERERTFPEPVSRPKANTEAFDAILRRREKILE